MVRCVVAVVSCWLAAGCSARVATVLIAREPRDAQVTDAGTAISELDARAQVEDSGPSPSADDAAADTSVATEAGSLPGACRIEGASSGFYETFAGSALDDDWLVAHGTHSFAGRTPRGGFVRDNVAVRDGDLILTVRGDRYVGPVRGFSSSGEALSDGRRSGAAVVTRNLFASGTYQVEGRFVAPPGVELAMWMMADDDSAGGIDIAVPGLLTTGASAGSNSYGAVRMQTRTSRAAAASALNQLLLDQSLDDGQAHILRFDWYTTAMPSVQFWLDDMPRWSSNTHLPDGTTRRMWIVAWLPGDAPADFESAEVRVNNAFITPFGNDGDRCSASTIVGPGLALGR
jgi:hypothetical protein